MLENKFNSLKIIRKNNNLTLRDVEKATNISNAYLSQLENGKIKNPAAKILAQLSEFYKIPYEQLLASVGHIDKSTLSIQPSYNGAGLVASSTVTDKSRELSTIDVSLLDDNEKGLVAGYVDFLASRKKT